MLPIRSTSPIRCLTLPNGPVQFSGVCQGKRHAVKERDNYTCFYCKSTGSPLEIDHIIPVSKAYLLKDLAPHIPYIHHKFNLVTACHTCNHEKDDKILPKKELEKVLTHARTEKPTDKLWLTPKQYERLDVIA